MSPATLDRIQALILEALDYGMGPVPRSLLAEAASLLNPEPEQDSPSYPPETGQMEFRDAETKIPWLVVLVPPGEKYGIFNRKDSRACVNDSGCTLVEFWDRRYDHDPEHHAQFVSRYYLSSLKGRSSGLCLDGGHSEWTISAESMLALNRQLLKFVEQ